MDRYNLVVLPVRDGVDETKRYIFSAGCPGLPRLVSPAWTLAEVRAALASMGVSEWQAEELLRGNRMAVGRRDNAYLYFSRERLDGIGLTPAPEPVEVEETA